MLSTSPWWPPETGRGRESSLQAKRQQEVDDQAVQVYSVTGWENWIVSLVEGDPLLALTKGLPRASGDGKMVAERSSLDIKFKGVTGCTQDALPLL